MMEVILTISMYYLHSDEFENSYYCSLAFFFLQIADKCCSVFLSNDLDGH